MCRPPRIPGNLEERTARRSLPATFVGGQAVCRSKMVCPQVTARVGQIGSNGVGQMEGTVNGIRYVLGLNRGRVGQFYPVGP